MTLSTLHNIPTDEKDYDRTRATLIGFITDLDSYPSRKSSAAANTDYPLTLKDAAGAVRKKGEEIQDAQDKKLHLNCRPETLRKLYVPEFLTDKKLGEGIGYKLTPEEKTKIHLSVAAVQFLAEHYIGLLTNGRKPQKRTKNRAEISLATTP